MSYLSVALQRRLERRPMSQGDLAKASGISRSYISRLMSGESSELSDANFASLLGVFAADLQAQAELIAARCMDVKAGVAKAPGAELVQIAVKTTSPQKEKSPAHIQEIELPHETEKAFAWLRSQCPINPELEKHLVGYAKLTGMK